MNPPDNEKWYRDVPPIFAAEPLPPPWERLCREKRSETPAKVDHLLHRQGEYLPLELLLAEGRLLYPDFDQWRAGAIEYLDDCLFGDSETVVQLLSEAAQYARALGLLPQAIDYKGWGGGAALTFSRDAPFDVLFRTGFRKDRSIPQLDLFLDNTGNNLANEAVAALGDRDPAKARAAIDQLIRVEPLHPRIDPLLGLIELSPETGFDEAALRRLDREIAPLAHELLGQAATNYLIPLWRRAAEALDQEPFVPDNPDRHASRLWESAGDPANALAAVEREPRWRDQPELLISHAAACARLQRHQEALLDLFRLCWAFPGQIANAIERLEGLYQHPWRRFLDDDHDLGDSDFPAWLLIQHPLHVEQLNEKQLAGLDPAPGFLSLLRLVCAERQRLSPEYRAALKGEHPALLACYLKRR
ncbi:MAG: hypothetical protein KJ558_06115 [Gammaproteobacteria bacterium]|nr:hypothetical protein [Gammaproteobacteria bacterium]MBU1654393.1 hypothetical protein [Gammaproteobacteria bacterium]MBU1960234.1 hypothetical protein [Gammaproteobacteria bacterium]